MLNFINLFIHVFLSLGCGLGLVGLSLDIKSLEPKLYIDVLTYVVNSNLWIRTAIFLIGLLIILNLFRNIQLVLLSQKRNKTIKTESEQGNVSITLTAIEDLIRKTLEEDTIISFIRPKIYPSKKEIIIQVKLGLKSITNIKTFSEAIQTKINNKLSSVLGSEKKLRINIEIQKISFPRKEKSAIEENDDTDKDIGPLRNFN